MIKKTAAVIGVDFSKSDISVGESLRELSFLANTLGISVSESFQQNRKTPDSGFFIGRGKAAEIGKECEAKNIALLIFDDELTPTQQRNIEFVTGIPVTDRTGVILQIFANRARSREAKLQIELAEKYYNLSRLKSKDASFEQQVGVAGIRSGFGEKKLEIDKRKLRDRISYLKKEIEKIKYHREVQRTKRMEVPMPVVSIVGYTNAGKSTLLNRLVKKNAVYADDKLFATLDTTTRRVPLPSGGVALFTDTVGFIRKLPHKLVAAFKSTLEEIKYSDLILHLIDVSDANWKISEATVLEVLKDIGVSGIPVISVYNKCDLVRCADMFPSDRMSISAYTGQNVGNLLADIDHLLWPDLERRTLMVPFPKTYVLNKIKKIGRILRTDIGNNGLNLEILIDRKNWLQIIKIISL